MADIKVLWLIIQEPFMLFLDGFIHIREPAFARHTQRGLIVVENLKSDAIDRSIPEQMVADCVYGFRHITLPSVIFRESVAKFTSILDSGAFRQLNLNVADCFSNSFLNSP